MMQSLDDVLGKIKEIKEEVDKVEFRVMNTRSHVETIEKELSTVGKEILEGFHIVSGKVNHLEKVIEDLEKKIDDLSKNSQ